MSTEKIEFNFIDEEESCKNSQLDSPLALTEMDNIDRNKKPTNTQNGKQKENDEMMIQNHEDIKKKKRTASGSTAPLSSSG